MNRSDELLVRRVTRKLTEFEVGDRVRYTGHTVTDFRALTVAPRDGWHGLLAHETLVEESGGLFWFIDTTLLELVE